MAAQSLDLGGQFHKPPFQDRRRIMLRTIQNRANIIQLQARLAVHTNLLQSPRIFLAISTVPGSRSRYGFQQADGFVVQQRAAAKTAAPGEFGNCQHRPVLSLKCEVIDRSRSIFPPGRSGAYARKKGERGRTYQTRINRILRVVMESQPDHHPFLRERASAHLRGSLRQVVNRTEGPISDRVLPIMGYNPPIMALPRLTINFLEDSAYALRRVTQANWNVECLVSSRSALPGSLGNNEIRKYLDVPGVYLLVGPPPKNSDDNRLYVGQADSVADRLDTHLKNDGKTWFRTVIVIKRPDNEPLNLSQCKFLESKLCAQASSCELENKNAPQPPALSEAEESETEDLLGKATVIVGALGWNFFEPCISTAPTEEESRTPQPPPNLQHLFEELRRAVTGPSLPKAEGYWTRTPDFRAKVVSGDDFRVFVRICWAKNWFRVELKNVENFKIGDLADLEKHRDKIQTAYDKADKYLQRGK